MALNVFISYSHQDRQLRDELATHLSNLRQQRVINDWYDGAIAPGSDIQAQILLYLNQAQLILLLISADFMASEFSYSVEMQQAIARHKANEACVIPIILRPTDWEGAPFSGLKALPLDGKPVTRWSSHDEAFEDVMKGLRATIKELNAKPLARPSTSGTPSMGADQVQVWNIPLLRNRFFIGREDILNKLQEALNTGKMATLSQPLAISGLGGIGKTQTALEYAYRYHDNYHVIIWMNADTNESLVADLANVAKMLNLPEKNEQNPVLIINALKRWLQVNSNWLLILDNVENLEIVRTLIPQFARGHILITTRLQAVGTLASQVEIDKMKPDVGALFLLRRSGIIETDAPLTNISKDNLHKAQEISSLMDGLPLALDQAGSYIEETQCGLSGYSELYQIKRSELLRRRGGSSLDHPESVSTTFSLSFDRVQRANLAAADLLRLIIFLYPIDIPEDIITKGSSELGSDLQPVASDLFALNDALGELLKYSLVHRDPNARTITVHRLVQAVFNDIMDEDTKRLWSERAIRTVNKVLPETNLTSKPLYRPYLPHALACTELIRRWQMKFPEATHLLFQTANCLQNSARYSQAELLYRQALTIGKEVLGSQHPDIASCLSQLGWNYYLQGDFNKARQNSKQALEIREKVLGPEHPDTASSLNQLGVILRRLGDYTQAEQFYKRALTIYAQTTGLENSEAAFTLQNLGVLYRSQHFYIEAEKFASQALEIRKKLLGPQHLDIAFSYNNIALIYYDQKKYNEAEQLFQKALLINEKEFGPDHPNVAFSLRSLAILYHTQRMYDKAESFYQRALSIYEQTEALDEGAFKLKRLAELDRAKGELDKAESHYQRALAISEKLFGSEHPNLLRNLNDLASLYSVQRKYGQAGEIYRRILAIHEQTTGPESPNTIKVRKKYADLMRKIKRETEQQE